MQKKSIYEMSMIIFYWQYYERIKKNMHFRSSMRNTDRNP